MSQDELLNLDYLRNVRDAFNESPIFSHFKKYRNNNFQNLFICTTNRLQESADYLNSHTNAPSDSNQLILLLFHSIQIYNGVKKLLEFFKIDNGFESPKEHYFADVFKINKIRQQCSDDLFFEYIRSLALAHPFDTDTRKRPFMVEGEIHTSNWIDGSGNKLSRMFSHNMPKEHFKICYLSNKSNNFEWWIIPLHEFKSFIQSKWNKLQNISNKMIQAIIKQNDRWQKKKCDRKIANPIKAFKNIRDILKSRLIENTYEIDKIISYYKVKLTLKCNQQSVDKFLSDIADVIDGVRDLVDHLEYEPMYTLLDEYVNARPRKVHQMCGYELEKIHSYLHGKRTPFLSANQEWGLTQARDFSRHFAKKWVKYDIENMSFEEIILLTDAACYLEAREQQLKIKKA